MNNQKYLREIQKGNLRKKKESWMINQLRKLKRLRGKKKQNLKKGFNN